MNMKAILVTYNKDVSCETAEVEIDVKHDFSKGPYQDTVPFSVGSNQNVIPIDSSYGSYGSYGAIAALKAEIKSLNERLDHFALAGAEVTLTELFASDVDDETYVIRDKSGQEKMLMTGKPGSKWKNYVLIDSDQYRSDLMERHGIRHAEFD